MIDTGQFLRPLVVQGRDRWYRDEVEAWVTRRAEYVRETAKLVEDEE